MSDKIFTLDLTTKNTFDESSFNEVKEKIRKIKNPISSDVSDSCELTKRFKIEIYTEAVECSFDDPEDLIDFVSEIESIVGGFDDNSRVEWVSQFPHCVKTWEKCGYEWSLILEEEDDYFDKKTSWEEWEEDE